MRRAVVRAMAAGAVALLACPAAVEVTLTIAYLRQVQPRPPVLSDLDPVPADEGLRGAELAISELATTGAFLGHAYVLAPVEVAPKRRRRLQPQTWSDVTNASTDDAVEWLRAACAPPRFALQR